MEVNNELVLGAVQEEVEKALLKLIELSDNSVRKGEVLPGYPLNPR
jgi:hypothetical protein